MLVKETLNFTLVYQVFQYLLDKTDESNDEVVQVTAGWQLKNGFGSFSISPVLFMPHASTVPDRQEAQQQKGRTLLGAQSNQTLSIPPQTPE